MAKQTKASVVTTETQRESIINRPYNLAGSIKHIKKERFNITQDDVILKESTVVPALMKLFMESLDNPIDMAIKGACSKIDIKVTKDTITVTDDGAGVSSQKDAEEISNVFRAFCIYNSGSNYGEAAGKGQKGINGIGIKLCTTLSSHMKVISDDGVKKVTIVATENNLHHKITEAKSSGKTGVTIEFKPDFNIFAGTEIDQEHIDRMYEYTLIQSLTYPEVTFRFNGKQVKYTPRKFTSLLGGDVVMQQEEDYFFGFTPNKLDDFRQISYVNGLELSRGGSHVDYIVDRIVKGIREKLIKKYKTIKPADIKNKLMFVMIGRNMHDIDWEGQVKDAINSSTEQMKSYYGDVPFDAIIKKIMKNSAIMDPITEFYKLKEQRDKNIQLKKADKKTKPKSDKFMPPIGNWTNIFVAEGDSAAASISKILGRQGNGFYAMFGVPPNAWAMPLTGKNSIVASKKLTDLKDILGLKYSTTTQDDINFQNIIIATDFDLPGHFITGQLIGLFFRFGENLFKEKRIKRFVTPLLIAKDSKEKIVEWFYNFEDYQAFMSKNKTKKYTYDYKKGLGSWDVEELETVIAKDGLDNMLVTFTSDDLSREVIDNWLNKKKTNIRKDMLDGYEFNIMNT